MNPDSSPASFPDSTLGQRLRTARVAQGLSIEDVCERLKLPAGIVDAMEADDHERLGAAVFARGRLGNYARLVGVPMVAVDAVFARLTRELPALITARSVSRVDRLTQRFARQGVYIALTAIIFVVPVVWIANGNRLPDAPAALNAPALTALDAPSGSNHAVDVPAASIPDQRKEDQHNENEVPVVASMAPFPGYRSPAAQTVAVAAPSQNPVGQTAGNTGIPAGSGSDGTLHLHFSADSWVDVVGNDGRSLYHGMIRAGSDSSYPAGIAARVTIGNAAAVQASRNGQVLDLAPFLQAKSLHFTLSSDGSPAHVSN